jgi:hypothetical protein
MSLDGEGENPREEKAQEGRDLWFGLIHRPEEQTLVGSKALKWRLSPRSCVNKYAAG